VKFFFEGQEYLYRIVKILSEENRPSRAPTSAQGHDEHAAGKLGKFSIPRESGRANAQQRTRRARAPPSNCGAAIFWRLLVRN